MKSIVPVMKKSASMVDSSLWPTFLLLLRLLGEIEGERRDWLVIAWVPEG